MAFNALINSIAPKPTPPDWVRPSDWIPITDTANEVQFLVADVNQKAFSIRTTFVKNAGTNIYIDWGDGVTDTISTETLVTTDHVYSTGGTPCSRGYNTFKIRIYGDATCQITNARHIANFAITGGSPYYNIGLLEAYFGDNTCNTNALETTYFQSSNSIALGTFNFLEYVKLPATVTWTNQMAAMFANCTALYKVIMPTSASNLTDVNSSFITCFNLLDITFPSNSTLITTLLNTFNNCINLRTVSLPTSLNSCTTLENTFFNCTSLKNVTFPSINAVTNLVRCFSSDAATVSASSLQWVRFTSMPSPASPGTSVDFSFLFFLCANLQNVYFPETCSNNAIYDCRSLFNTCHSLKNIIFPVNFQSVRLESCFVNCISLTNVTFQAPMPNLNNITSCFSGCSLLNSITLPSTASVTLGISVGSTFNNCYSLSSITIPSGWNITTLNSAFNNCFNLKSITLPNNAQNSCNSMSAMAQNCYKLETIVMPTSLNLVNSLSSTFLNCQSLKSVTLPATMNSVSSCLNVFNNCYSLSSVTMPTSMTACTSFENSFINCFQLTTLTMPATVSSTVLTTYRSLVSGCSNLKTLTLPTTQSSAVSLLTSMLGSCGNLTTINNLDKVGGNLISAPKNTATGFATGSYLIPSLSLTCPFNKLTLNGISATSFNKITSLRLLNAATGQWGGTSPQIDVSFCSLSTAALVTLFNDIAAQGNVTSKTINITSCTGAAGLTAADRLILTSRGWTITG